MLTATRCHPDKDTDNGGKNGKNPDMPNQGTVEHSDDGRLKSNRENGDRQEFRVGAAIVDPKEIPDGTTQSTPYS
ncbi:hypothetical protein [Methylobacterium sp. D54C]